MKLLITSILAILFSISSMGQDVKVLYKGGPSYLYPERIPTGTAHSCSDLNCGNGDLPFPGPDEQSGETYYYDIPGIGERLVSATLPTSDIVSFEVRFNTHWWKGSKTILCTCSEEEEDSYTGSEYVNVVDFSWTRDKIEVCKNDPAFDVTKYLNFTDGVELSGSGINGKNFNPSLVTPGTHIINASKNFDNGLASIPFTIVVKALPAFDFFPPKGICDDDKSLDLSDYTSANNIKFTGPGIEGSILNPNGYKDSVLVTATYIQGCTNSIKKPIMIIPTFTVSAGENKILCPDSLSINMQASPMGGMWKGINIIGNKFTPAGLEPGNYTFTYEVNQSGCIKSDSVVITLPVAPKINLGNDTNLCKNNSPIALIAQPAGGTWKGPEGALLGSTLYPGALKAGTNQIEYTIQDQGCKYNKSKKIFIYNTPEKPSITGDEEVCLGDTLLLTASAGPDSNLQFEWFKEGHTLPFAQGKALSYHLTKVEKIYVQSKNIFNCYSDEKAMVILKASGYADAVITSDKTNIKTGEVVKFSIDATNYSSLKWDFGDSTYSIDDHPAKYYYDADTFDVRAILISPLGCASEIIAEKIITVLGKNIEKVTPADIGTSTEIEEQAIAYPNPFQSSIQVIIQLNENNPVEISISDIHGRKIFKDMKAGITGPNRFYVNTNDLVNGIYLVSVRSEKLNKIFTLVK